MLILDIVCLGIETHTITFLITVTHDSVLYEPPPPPDIFLYLYSPLGQVHFKQTGA